MKPCGLLTLVMVLLALACPAGPIPSQAQGTDALMPVPGLPPTLILLSNHPEKVEQRGLLFDAGLLPGRPVRFQYYHQGGTALPDLRLTLIIKNPGKVPASLAMISGCGGPADAFSAGHGNALDFLPKYAGNQGSLLTLAPNTEKILADIPLPPEKVVSATNEFLLLQGSQVHFYLFARGGQEEACSFPGLRSSDTHTKGAYPACNLYLSKHFDAGQSETYLSIGDTPLPNLFRHPDLKGCYGVIYELRLYLSNYYSGTAQKITLSLQPRGGKGAGVYYLQSLPPGCRPGLVLDIPPQPAYQAVTLTHIILPPGAAKNFRLLTMPEGASNYPMRIWIRSEAYEN